MAIKKLIEKNLNFILIMSMIIGIVTPGLELIPDITIVVMLGIIVFFSTSKVSISGIAGIDKKSLLIFYILRFIFFPFVIYSIFYLIYPQYALGVLLISAMPVGVTTPSLVDSMKGDVTLAFAMTILTSLLAPIIVPAIILFSGHNSHIEIDGLLKTILIAVIIPMALYIVISKKSSSIKKIVENNSSVVSILLLGAIIAIVISRQKVGLMSDAYLFFHIIGITFICFLLMYSIGWIFCIKKNLMQSIAYTMCSGANNNALAISISFIYFSKNTSLFVVISEFSWALAIPVIGYLYKKSKASHILEKK